MKTTMTDDFGHECAEIRVLPHGDGANHGNTLCGRRGYEREMAFRRDRNPHVAYPFPLPAWESLAVYFPEGQR